MYSSYNDPQLMTWFQASVLLHLIFGAGLYVHLELTPPVLRAEKPITQEAAPVLFHEIPSEDLPLPDMDSELFELAMNESSHFGTTKAFQEIPELDLTSATKTIEDNQEKPTEQLMKLNHEEISVKTPDTTPEPYQSDTMLVQEDTISMPEIPKTFWEERAHKKSASPVSGLTLANLAEGFIDYVKVNRAASTDINSQDLKTLAYNNKIGWYLQNSFRIHNKPLTLAHPVKTNITLYIEIDKNGNLLNLDMHPKTGESELDNLLLKVIKNAHPVPPIPTHLNRSTYKFHLPIYVEAAQGTHSYHFTFKG
ncbi:TonB C-terminal domain-containing protein [Candidatus Babeliales bacterium]|nr:TonB C-terminal domain-containing protein [Candidatus Babeliales bacterium]